MMFSMQVEAPSAYVCAESRIYDATEWYICQVISVVVFSYACISSDVDGMFPFLSPLIHEEI